MRFPRLMLVGFLCCHAALAFAGENTSILHADPAEVDFGQAGQHQVCEAKVRLSNRGTEVVMVSSVSTSCECTSASLSKTKLLPDDDSTLEIKLETREEVGYVRRMVIVHASSGDLAVAVKLVVAPLVPR